MSLIPWWMQRSWLERQFVALEAVGSSPIFHPIIFLMHYILGCSQAVRHQTLTLACASSNLASPANKKNYTNESELQFFFIFSYIINGKIKLFCLVFIYKTIICKFISNFIPITNSIIDMTSSIIVLVPSLFISLIKKLILRLLSFFIIHPFIFY